MNIEFSSRLKGHYSGFSKSDKKIAEYLMQHAQTARFLSIQDLAQEIDVSMSAISRFTKKIGFANYQEMRMHLTDANAKQQDTFFITLDENDSMMNIAKATFQSGTSSLSSTLAVLNTEILENCIHLLGKSSSCGLFGLGASSVMVLNAYHRFIRTSLICCYAIDYHMQLMNAGRLSKNDCALIVSHTGKNKDILRIVEILKKNHVPIISITSNASSPLAKKSDFVLVSISEETKFRPEAVSSMISQIMLIDALFTLYAVKIDHNTAYFQLIREIVNTTRVP